MIRLIIFCLLPFYTSISVYSQAAIKAELEVVKNGHLLVQLFSRETTIEVIRKNQGDSNADKYRQYLLDKNKKLMHAFGEHFSFSKVLFFYSKDKEKIKSKDFDETTFYDFNHEIVKKEDVNINQFRIGEISRVIVDSVDHHLPNGEIEKHPTYLFSAFVLMDDQFRQYKKPNWFYVRTHIGAPFFQKREHRLVKSINSKMIRKSN